MMIPGIEWLRRSRVLAVAVFVTLGLILTLENTLAHAAQLTVSWSDATPDDHAGFKVERKTGTNGAFAQVTTTGPTVMYHLDTALTAGTNYCYRVRAYNTAGDSPYTPEGCAVAPTPVLRTVTVAKSGTGTGTVGSSPSGITCGSTCSATYTSGTSIALSATPTTGSTFTGWSGACTGTGGCALVLDADKSATAIFALSTPTTYTLTVSKAGTGTGTVTSSPSGISCGSACSASYNTGTSVTLTAAAATGSTFTGWGGACSGTGSCVVSMNAARTVTPTFATESLALQSVTANQASPQVVGTALTLTATATGGTAPYQFKWWVWNGSAWSVARDWAAGNTLNWTPSAPGTYEVHAWVRNSGVTADTWQAWGRLAYTVTAAPAPTMSSVTATQASPVVAGTPVTLTATTTGGVAPYQFKWWVWNGSAWSVARDWGTGNTLPWTPPASGNLRGPRLGPQ